MRDCECEPLTVKEPYNSAPEREGGGDADGQAHRPVTAHRRSLRVMPAACTSSALEHLLQLAHLPLSCASPDSLYLQGTCEMDILFSQFLLMINWKIENFPLIKCCFYQSLWKTGRKGRVCSKKMKRGYSSVLRTVDQLSIWDTEEDPCWLLAKKQQRAKSETCSSLLKANQFSLSARTQASRVRTKTTGHRRFPFICLKFWKSEDSLMPANVSRNAESSLQGCQTTLIKQLPLLPRRW